MLEIYFHAQHLQPSLLQRCFHFHSLIHVIKRMMVISSQRGHTVRRRSNTYIRAELDVLVDHYVSHLINIFESSQQNVLEHSGEAIDTVNSL